MVFKLQNFIKNKEKDDKTTDNKKKDDKKQKEKEKKEKEKEKEILDEIKKKKKEIVKIIRINDIIDDIQDDQIDRPKNDECDIEGGGDSSNSNTDQEKIDEQNRYIQIMKRKLEFTLEDAKKQT